MTIGIHSVEAHEMGMTKTKRIKILHILEVEKEAHYFNNLVDFADQSRFDFAFVTFCDEGPFSVALRRRGYAVYTLKATNKMSLLGAAFRLWRIIRLEKPTLLHTHLFFPTLIGTMLSRVLGYVCVTTRHHSDALHMIRNRWKRFVYLSMDRLNGRNANLIIAPSRMVQTCLVDWEGTEREKVTVIPYGQNSERFDSITQAEITAKRVELRMDEKLSFVCVSRLFHGKGHKYLFDAAVSLRRLGLNFRLYLVGTGDYKRELERYATEIGISDMLEFLGWRDDILEIIGAADVIVHPSLEDALSQALIESLMLAKPIVATDISGASDTLDGGKYGRLVPPADGEAIRDALLEIVNDLESAQSRAREGRKYLLEYMDAGRVVREHEGIYEKLASFE